MASIKRLEGKDGASYKITVSLGRDARGKQIRRYMTWKPEPGLTARQIEKRVKQVAVDFEKQLDYGFQADNRQTFDEYAQYVINLKLKSGAAVGSSYAYKHKLKLLRPLIGSKKMRDIRPQHIRKAYEELSKPGVKSLCGKAVAKKEFNEIAKKYGSRRELAEITGLSEITISRIFTKKTVCYGTAELVSNVLNQPITDLFEVDKQDDLRISGTTLLGVHHFLSVVFRQAELDMIITTNPMKRVQAPKKDKPKQTYFQPCEISDIFAAADKEPIKWKTMVYILALSGVRRGELLGLKWENIDFDRKQIEINSSITYQPGIGTVDGVTKTRKNRWMPLPEEAFKMLSEYRLWQTEQQFMWGDQWNNLGYVFPNEKGCPMYPNTLNIWLHKFSERHDLPPINPHAFRHTAASIMISRNIDIISVSNMLGHATAKTTMEVYAHAIEETKRNAAECIADTILRRQA